VNAIASSKATDTAEQVSAADLSHLMLALLGAVQRSSGARDVIALIDELDMTLTQFKLLIELEVRESPCSIKEAGGCVGLSLPAASRAADALVRRGLLERHEDEQDRRIKRLSLSPAGREAAGRIREARLAGIGRVARRMSPEERSRFAAAARPMLEAAARTHSEIDEDTPA